MHTAPDSAAAGLEPGRPDVLEGHDGSDATVNYTPAPPGGAPGQYELTPGVTSALTPQWGQVTPWAMTSGSQFLPPPPPQWLFPSHLERLLRYW